ncbi:MAG: hypothetical protein OEZ36_14140 [Spirochaetota bacterium]|nr:hypothetical protein [Spirochaetota bacterium]
MGPFKKLSLFIMMFFLIYSKAEAGFYNLNRKSNNSVYIKVSQGTFYSYQRLVRDWFGFNVGFDWLGFHDSKAYHSFIMPAYLSFYPVGAEHRIYVDFGVNFFLNFDVDVINKSIFQSGIFGLGYNYHPNDGGLFIKVGPELNFIKLDNPDKKWQLDIKPNLTLGYAF